MRETLTREQEAALDALKATILDPVQIPTEAERAFRLKPNTDSEGSRTPVPTESEQ